MHSTLLLVGAAATTGFLALLAGWAAGRVASRSDVTNGFLDGVNVGHGFGDRDGYERGYSSGHEDGWLAHSDDDMREAPRWRTPDPDDAKS